MALKGASGGSRGLKASPRVTMATPPALIAPNCALLIAPCFSPPSFACVRVHLFIATITFHFIDGYRKQGRFFCLLLNRLVNPLTSNAQKQKNNEYNPVCVIISTKRCISPIVYRKPTGDVTGHYPPTNINQSRPPQRQSLTATAANKEIQTRRVIMPPSSDSPIDMNQLSIQADSASFETQAEATPSSGWSPSGPPRPPLAPEAAVSNRPPPPPINS